nr:MAG TPA: hypothetical protein [Caudoviricetes sp.]
MILFFFLIISISPLLIILLYHILYCISSIFFKLFLKYVFYHLHSCKSLTLVYILYNYFSIYYNLLIILNSEPIPL